MEQSMSQTIVTPAKQWGIAVHSIGTTDANIVGALHKAIPVPENQLALKIYQAPSLLLNKMEKTMAEEINQLLNRIGLQTAVVHQDEAIEQGQGNLEVCLQAADYHALPKVLQQMQSFLGLPQDQSKQMLFQQPNVIMGKVSASTVAAIKQRFGGLGVEVRQATIAESRFILLVQGLTSTDHHQLKHVLAQYDQTHLLADSGYVLHSIDKATADRIWPHIKRFGAKAKLINQQFAEFDIRLEAHCATAHYASRLLAVLTKHTDIPEHLLAKVVERAPIMIKRNADHQQMSELYQALNHCQAKFSVLPVSMQYFNVTIKQTGDVNQSQQMIRWMSGCTEQQADSLLREGKQSDILLTAVQAHWLAHELKQVGTQVNLTLAPISSTQED